MKIAYEVMVVYIDDSRVKPNVPRHPGLILSYDFLFFGAVRCFSVFHSNTE
jgi:hypothetical protein